MAKAQQIRNQVIDPWLPSEISILKKSKGITKDDLLKKLPRRSWKAISMKRKRLGLPSIIRRVPWNKGLTKRTSPIIASAAEKESKRKRELFAVGKIKAWNKGVIGKHWSRDLHDKLLSKHLNDLKKEGFLCISLTKVIPDAIAIKDGKIYGVELERGSPDYRKYASVQGFEDVFWFVYRD